MIETQPNPEVSTGKFNASKPLESKSNYQTLEQTLNSNRQSPQRKI